MRWLSRYLAVSRPLPLDLANGWRDQIFTSEDVELPRKSVADYLESIDPKLCAKYLEYLIAERNEDSPTFHDRLAELYLSMVNSAKKRNDESEGLLSL